MVNHNAGIAQSYSKIKSLQSRVVKLVIDYYETTLEIEGSAQVWGRNFIVSLSPTCAYRSPGGLIVMHEMVDRGAIVQSDRWVGIAYPRVVLNLKISEPHIPKHNRMHIMHCITLQALVQRHQNVLDVIGSSGPNVLEDLEQDC